MRQFPYGIALRMTVDHKAKPNLLKTNGKSALRLTGVLGKGNAQEYHILYMQSIGKIEDANDRRRQKKSKVTIKERVSKG